MVIETKHNLEANMMLMSQMRHAGAPLREIAERVGISKERVRQILKRNNGTTKHEWFSTLELCQESGSSRNRVIKLQKLGVIIPEFEWRTGKRHYFLWAADTARQLNDYFNTYHLCQICNKPLPMKRSRFCSDACRRERHEYRYMTIEEKQRILESIHRYRERKKHASQALIS